MSEVTAALRVRSLLIGFLPRRLDFDDPTTLVAISTDFCHWGDRFDYTYYAPSPGKGPAKEAVGSASDLDSARPIWHSIRDLDREAMDILESFGDHQEGNGQPTRAAKVHADFNAYLQRAADHLSPPSDWRCLRR